MPPLDPPQSANYASLLTYSSPATGSNRDRFGKEIRRLLTKIPGSLPFVQVMRGATSGHKRGT
jgi:hypothetical protein